MVQDEINTVGGLWGDCGIGYSMESEMSYRTSGSSRNEMPMGKGGKKKQGWIIRTLLKDW